MRVTTLGLTVLLAADTAAAKTISLSTEDGVSIKANVEGSGERCAVLVHDAGRTRADWQYFAERLSSNGFRTLALDLRGHGETGGDLTDESYPAMVNDVGAAVSYLQKGGCTNLSIVGARLGAALALNVGATDTGVHNLVLLSMGLSVNGVRVASALTTYGDRPILFVASEEDVSGAKAARLLGDKASGDTHVELLDNAGVGAVMLNRAPSLEGLMVGWLNGTYHASKGENQAERDLQSGEVNDITTTGTKYGDRE